MAELWQEVCARRMTKTLAAKPRRGKTRAYVSSLPKRPSVAVAPEEFVRPISQAEARASAAMQAKRDQERYAAWVARGCPPSPSFARKDRLRPRARRVGAKPMVRILAEAQGWLCGICAESEVRFDVPDYHPMRATLDHVVPRARGGGNHLNRVAAHGVCNLRKSDRMPTGCERIWLSVANTRAAIANEAAAADETRSGSAVGESAGLKGIAQNQSSKEE